MMIVPTLFLDFDGVLHPSICREEDFFCRVPLVEEYLADLDLQVVIASSWRFHYSKNELLRRLPASLASMVTGVTGEAYVGKYSRWNEIQSYLALRNVGEWRALDDSRFEFPTDCKELIECNGSIGVEAHQLGLVREWCQRNRPGNQMSIKSHR